MRTNFSKLLFFVFSTLHFQLSSFSTLHTLYTRHFLHSTLRVFHLNLFLKASLGAHPFIWKWDFFHLQIKVIFIWMVVHQASLWWRGLGELRNGLFRKLWTMWDLMCRYALCANSDNCTASWYKARNTGHIHIPKLPEIVTKCGKDMRKVVKLIRDCSSE